MRVTVAILMPTYILVINLCHKIATVAPQQARGFLAMTLGVTVPRVPLPAPSCPDEYRSYNQ